ncbi:methyltransferase domain-containing protein [Gaetbulibacter sp. M240]|uniref:class I SAM-dependent methyltransferase n=1 Tax=Gaetbulibacter sp. M240 TaxID=3126511 RepID=UPI00374EA9D8
MSSIVYYSSDFADEFIADYTFDITNINQDDNTFDTIIAYHILEHISDDKKAMTELFRVLKPNGRVFIQTPFKPGEIYEDSAIKTSLERLKHFGQEDHVRIYSISGLKKRLEAVGFKVDVTIFKYDESDDYKGFLSPETILIGIKS